MEGAACRGQQFCRPWDEVVPNHCYGSKNIPDEREALILFLVTSSCFMPSVVANMLALCSCSPARVDGISP